MSDDRNPDTRDEIVIEGERHFHNSGGQYRKPYPIYSDAFNRFERGWTQALKKSNSDPIKRPPSESEYLFFPNPRNALSSNKSPNTNHEKDRVYYPFSPLGHML